MADKNPPVYLNTCRICLGCIPSSGWFWLSETASPGPQSYIRAQKEGSPSLCCTHTHKALPCSQACYTLHYCNKRAEKWKRKWGTIRKVLEESKKGEDGVWEADHTHVHVGYGIWLTTWVLPPMQYVQQEEFTRKAVKKTGKEQCTVRGIISSKRGDVERERKMQKECATLV